MTTSFIVPILTGPTCSGKSDYAIALAQKQETVIINADAMQLYRDLPILTAQPSDTEQSEVPHFLYGVLDGAEHCSVARWVDLAVEEIRRAVERGQRPMLVGGSGMYLKALIEGLAHVPPVPATIREEVRERMAVEGNDAFHRWFSALDPVMAARLQSGDTQRLIRAAEVWLASGTSLSVWQSAPTQSALPEAEFQIHAILRPRAELYARINARFLRMLERGALEEVKRLHARRLPEDLPVLRSHGVPEIIAWSEGRLSFDAMVAKGQQNTRNYAKRQQTWIRNQFPDAILISL